MSKQVVTIGYLKTFVEGVLTVSSAYADNTYCPTYGELVGGDLVTNYKADTNPTKTTNGIKINGCSVTDDSTAYSDNQLVIQRDLQLLYQELQSIDVAAATSPVSCCGGSSTLSTTAYFKLSTKTTGGTSVADTATSAVVTASYSENKTYTSIDGSSVKFDKNTINYPTSTKANERDTTVTASYTYSGVTKEDTVTVKQSANEVGGWTWKSDTTTSIAISKDPISFGSCEGSIDYSVTRYYDSYYEKYDTCGTKMDSKTDKNSATVTPSEASVTGSFTCSTTKVNATTNTGAYRTGTLTVKYDNKTDTSTVTQAASQAGRYYGAAYGHDFWFYVEPDTDDTVSCDGATVTFQSYYWSTYKKDYVDKDHCGNQTGSGTESYPSTINVTSNTTWESDRGTMSSNVLTIGSTTSDVTTNVTATYNAQPVYTVYEIYQSGCKPSCMNVKYTVESGVNCTVYYKTTNGTQQAQHSVSKTGDQELCNIAEGTEIVVSCSDTGVTLTGDVSFTYQKGSDIYIGLNKKNSGGGTTPSAPKLNNFFIQNNLPDKIMVETPLSNGIDTIGTDQSQSYTGMVETSGMIFVYVPKASMRPPGSSQNAVCDSCHIAICTDTPQLKIKTMHGNFEDTGGDIWWSPTLAFYNGEGGDAYVTLQNGDNNEITVNIHNNGD